MTNTSSSWTNLCAECVCYGLKQKIKDNQGGTLVQLLRRLNDLEIFAMGAHNNLDIKSVPKGSSLRETWLQQLIELEVIKGV